MMDTSPRPVSTDVVLIPTGNVRDVTVIHMGAGTSQKKPKRRYVRRIQIEKEQEDG